MSAKTLFAVLVALLQTSVYAANPLPAGQLPGDRPPSADEIQLPALSATGKKRLQQNIKTLETNLRDLKENLAASEKNLQTIQTELKDLDGLEKEHVELKKKYEAYLAGAEEEKSKNEKARRDLAKWEQTNKAAPKEAADGTLKDKLEAARLEQVDRERWKIDADGKTARVKDLMVGIERNLRDLRSRRKPLEQQLVAWNGRKTEYQKLIGETETKKIQWEKTMNR